MEILNKKTVAFWGRACFLCISLFFSLCVSAQNKQAAIWYFGKNAGLDFNTNPPTLLTDGQINTLEGSSVASDENGNLLFYTDGVTVWTKNHQIMPNGSGLYGHTSSTQSAMIVKHNSTPNLYYIFTTSAADIGSNGFCYSVVDINQNNGFGIILPSKKNIKLLEESSEKITAAFHANGNDIWIFSRKNQTNQWYAYLLTENGLTSTPVISAVGLNTLAGYGQAKTSPSNDLMMCADISMANVESKTQVEFFSLDRSTGKLQLIATSPAYTNSTFYGIEFSPNGQYAYLNLTNFLTWKTQILQVKIVDNMPDFSNIQTIAEFKYPPSNTLSSGALQVAIDGKIYISMLSKYLSVINNPNNFGSSCNFSLNSINLSPKSSNEGLPTIFQTFSLINTISVSGDNCDNIRNFSIQNYSKISNLIWDFGDGTTSVAQKPMHAYATTGAYTVTLTITYTDNTTQTITKEIEISEKPPKPTIEHE